MAQVWLDPPDLRRFAGTLEQEVSRLLERRRALEASRQALSAVWRDARFVNFERAYLPAMAELDRFCKTANSYASYLRKKADRADRYLGRR